MLAEPSRTQGDLKFTLFGFPVRVHPMFWLVALLLGPIEAQPILSVLWIPAVFLSVLVHELGHALVMRRFRFQAHIVLYGMGGLAVPDGLYARQPGRRGRILISLAGPGAGFALAAVITLLFLAARQPVSVGGPWDWLRVVPHVDFAGSWIVGRFVNDLLWISVFWGLINLLPIDPLDGGHVSAELFTMFHPREGLRQSLIVSMVTAGAVAAYMLTEVMRGVGAGGGPPRGLFTVLFFGYLAYGSYVRLQQEGRGPW